MRVRVGDVSLFFDVEGAKRGPRRMARRADAAFRVIREFLGDGTEPGSPPE